MAKILRRPGPNCGTLRADVGSTSGFTSVMTTEGYASAEASSARSNRRARQIGAGVFLSFVVVWVIAASTQITLQIFWPEPTKNGPPLSCSETLLTLHQAVLSGQAAAEADTDAAAALGHFRAAVDPVWAAHANAKDVCVSPADRRSLDALERLRYAEEHAVRREATSLAALRKQVAADVASRE